MSNLNRARILHIKYDVGTVFEAFDGDYGESMGYFEILKITVEVNEDGIDVMYLTDSNFLFNMSESDVDYALEVGSFKLHGGAA